MAADHGNASWVVQIGPMSSLRQTSGHGCIGTLILQERLPASAGTCEARCIDAQGKVAVTCNCLRRHILATKACIWGLIMRFILNLSILYAY